MSTHDCIQILTIPEMKGETVLIEHHSGPQPDGPQRCIACLKTFQDGEIWYKVWDVEHEYAVAIHAECIPLL